MKMKNPFFSNKLFHYYLVWEYLLGKEKKVLDYGCGEGDFIGNLKTKIKYLYGVDVDISKVKKAKRKFPFVKFSVIKVGKDLPYKDSFFDAAFMFHTLEHVDSEKRTINEIYRVLKKKGILYLASPYKGLFAWADTANLRFLSPNLHRLLFSIFFGKKEYKKRFQENINIRLFGDISLGRNWHKHYTQSEVQNLLRKKFRIIKFEKFSFFHPFLLILINICNLIFKQKWQVLERLVILDNKLRMGDLSYNMLVIARKK